MVCPKCERIFDLLSFKRLEMPEGWEDDLTPVYRCPKNARALGPEGYQGTGGCGYIFAPAEESVANYLSNGGFPQ